MIEKRWGNNGGCRQRYKSKKGGNFFRSGGDKNDGIVVSGLRTPNLRPYLPAHILIYSSQDDTLLRPPETAYSSADLPNYGGLPRDQR